MDIRGTSDTRLIRHIEGALKAIPRDHLALVPFIQVSRRSCEASVHEDTHRIKVCKQQVKRDYQRTGHELGVGLSYTLAHEVGHVYQLVHGDVVNKWIHDYQTRMARPYDFDVRAIQEAEWRGGVKTGFPCLFPRAIVDWREVFAAAYAMFIHEREKLRDRCPELYEFLAERVFIAPGR